MARSSINIRVLLLLVWLLLWADPVIAACEPYTLTPNVTPTVSVSYGTILSQNVSLTWTGSVAELTIDMSAHCGLTGCILNVGSTDAFLSSLDPGNYTLYVRVVEASVTGTLYTTSRYVSLLTAAGNAAVTPGTYDFTIASTDDINNIYLTVTGNSHDDVYLSGTWQIAVVDEGCPFPSAPTPTPTATTTPQPTATTQPREIMEVPQGCDGVEMVVGSNPADPYGQTIIPGWGSLDFQSALPSGYEYFSVRYIFGPVVGETTDMEVTVYNSPYYQQSVSFYGDLGYYYHYPGKLFEWAYSYHDNAYYATTRIENTGDIPIFLRSICIMPVRTTRQCENYDSEFELGMWETLNAQIVHGIAHIFQDGGVSQQQSLMPGSYRISLAARTGVWDDTGGTVTPIKLTTKLLRLSDSATILDETRYIPSADAPTWFYHEFTVASGYEESVLQFYVDGYQTTTGEDIEVYWACIESLSDPATPTVPPPTPTPTAIPHTECMYPPSYDFSLPHVWTLNGSVISGDTVLLLLNGSSAQQNLTLAQGTWLLTTYAVRGVSGGAQAAFAVSLGDREIGEWVIPGSIPIQEEHAYMRTFYHYGGNAAPFMVRASIPGYYGGTISQICLSYLGDDSPLPTPTATSVPPATPTPGGPTLTPTPPVIAPAIDCLNPDPNIEGTGTEWVVLGDGGSYILDGDAYVKPGDQLASEMIYDTQHEYDMWISGYCPELGTAAVYWRGQMQMLYCMGGNMPFTRAFLWLPYEGAAMMSTPLLDILQQQPGEEVLPYGLPDGFAPRAFGPLSVEPFVSPVETPEYELDDVKLFSPLAEPPLPVEFPDAVESELDSINMMLSHIFQLQAMEANTDDIVITSVCVRDRGWTPPPDVNPDQPQVYHPVCERDHVVQRAFSADHPAQLIGPGARAGMPVNAVFAGRVDNSGASEFQVFGGQRYDGCVVVNHFDQLSVGLYSLYCNLDTFTVLPGMDIGRGDIVGYTSADLAGTMYPGLLAFALQLDGTYVDPAVYTVGWSDCRPYQVIVDPIERCSADDGSGAIPPRYNLPSPSIWEPQDWVPWLARRLYDTVGYPILCAIVPIINQINTWISAAVNSLLSFFSPLIVFFYRISRLFEYALDLAGRILTAFAQMFEDMATLTACYRSIITYFVSAMQAAQNAERPALDLPSGMLAYAINLALLLVSSTVANSILVPLVGLLIAYSAWQLVPWGIRHIRSAIGVGD